MTDESPKTPAEQAFEVLVYAPIGLLFEGSTLLPQLVEHGRNQVNMAKMIGRFAVEQGRGEAVKTASKLGDQAAGLLEFLGASMSPASAETVPPPAKAPRRPSRASGRAMAAAKTGAKPPGERPAAASKDKATAGVRADDGSAQADVNVASLAITDYDGLSASHVVNRLAGLAPDELESVRRYEAANRGRKTILSKISQLQSR